MPVSSPIILVIIVACNVIYLTSRFPSVFLLCFDKCFLNKRNGTHLAGQLFAGPAVATAVGAGFGESLQFME